MPTTLANYRGLNTKDHPSSLVTQDGVYLSKAINVDITDIGGIAMRPGYSVITELTNAHSLTGFKNRFAIYADGKNLFCYDTTTGLTSTLKSDLTSGKLLDYTPVGEELIFSNGVERGIISGDTPSASSYYAFVAEDIDDGIRTTIEFPLVDLMHFYNGAMYGAVKGESFLYSSLPYKPGQYDAEDYILVGSPINWISSVEDALLIGTDSGITAYTGHGLVDFQERVLLQSPSRLCSGRTQVVMSDVARDGVLALTDSGIFFITGQLESVDMTSKIPAAWETLSEGCFGVNDNQYVFTGGTG